MIFQFCGPVHPELDWRHSIVDLKVDPELRDAITIIGNQLYALGHRASYVGPNAPFIGGDLGYNVVVGGFADAMGEKISTSHGNGARFLYLVTGRPPAFPPPLVRCFDAALSMGLNAGTRWTRPVANIELGYAPTLMKLSPAAVPQYDVGFFGAMSRRRQKILKKMHQKINVLIVDGADQKMRDDAIYKVKIVLQLREIDDVPEPVSASECNTAMCLGRPVLADSHARTNAWGEIVNITSSMDDFYAECRAMVNGRWRDDYTQQFTKFAKLTSEVCLGEPLRKIGINVMAPKKSVIMV